MMITDKLLTSIEKLHKNVESNWQAELERINLWNAVSFLYDTYERRSGNIILAFAVYGYSLQSPWLEDSAKVDRFECLENIMKQLNSGQITPALEDVIYRRDPVANQLIDVILDRQPDARFRDVLTAYSYHARAHRMDYDTEDAKKFLEVGRCLQMGQVLRKNGDELMKQIRVDYLNLDTALEKQGMQKLSDRALTWEDNIRRKLEAKRKKQAHQDDDDIS